MKKSILILSLAAFCFSCGNNNEKSNTAKPAADNPEVEKGMGLVAKSDCLGCHKVAEASIGPAYNLIGKKYDNTEANINILAEKIQNGGSGNWGTVPMAAHSGISKEDAKAMATYVLSLKNEK